LFAHAPRTCWYLPPIFPSSPAHRPNHSRYTAYSITGCGSMVFSLRRNRRRLTACWPSDERPRRSETARRTTAFAAFGLVGGRGASNARRAAASLQYCATTPVAPQLTLACMACITAWFAHPYSPRRFIPAATYGVPRDYRLRLGTWFGPSCCAGLRHLSACLPPLSLGNLLLRYDFNFTLPAAYNTASLRRRTRGSFAATPFL